MKVAVLGASGFVGNAVMRQLAKSDDISPVAFARTTGNSWELLRQGIDVQMLDVKDRAATMTALSGFDAVVNCSRGGSDDMIGGLGNIVDAAREGGVKRLVHLSSISIYGDLPEPASRDETALPRPSNEYGAMKLRQDEMIETLAASGNVSTVTLCPPNITGPGSGFLLQVVQTIAAGRLLRLEGEHVCAMVDVDNLAHAVRCALTAKTSGRRYFVTDGQSPTWSTLIERLLPLTYGAAPPPVVSWDALSAAFGTPVLSRRKTSIFGSMKRLAAPEIRSALAEDEGWKSLFKRLKNGIMKLPPPVLDRIAAVASPPASVNKRSPLGDMDVRFSGQQLRGVDHSCAAAGRELGYEPLYSNDESIKRFIAWYGFMWPPPHREGRAGRPIGELNPT